MSWATVMQLSSTSKVIMIMRQLHCNLQEASCPDCAVTLTYLELQPEFVMQHQQEPSWPTACCEVTAITSVKSAEGENLSVVNVRYLINFNVILSAWFFGQTFFVARGSAMVSSFSFRIRS
jgi:hypothetical protein